MRAQISQMCLCFLYPFLLNGYNISSNKISNASSCEIKESLQIIASFQTEVL